jgi:hypothetical protein
MALEVIDSRYGEYKKQLHDVILLVLAKEYPLKIGEICHRLKNEFHVELSFQAIRKSLNAMVERKILSLKDKSYSIDKNYSLELKRISDQIMRNYFAGDKRGKSLPTQTKEAISTYEFETLILADQFVNEVIFDLVYNMKESDDNRFFFNGPHLWYVFAHLGMEQAVLEDVFLHKIKIYNLTNGNTVLDKWEKKFYGKYGRYQINPDSTEIKTALNVFGEYIIQYDYPEEIYSRLEEFYQSTKDLETLDLIKIADILRFKTKIKVMVMKNKTIADKLREEILSKFKE